MLRLQFDDTRKAAVARAMEKMIRTSQIVFGGISFEIFGRRQRAKSIILDTPLSQADKRMTATVYRCIMEVVNPHGNLLYLTYEVNKSLQAS
jgi:hypothetical protein